MNPEISKASCGEHGHFATERSPWGYRERADIRKQDLRPEQLELTAGVIRDTDGKPVRLLSVEAAAASRAAKDELPMATSTRTKHAARASAFRRRFDRRSCSLMRTRSFGSDIANLRAIQASTARAHGRPVYHRCNHREEPKRENPISIAEFPSTHKTLTLTTFGPSS